MVFKEILRLSFKFLFDNPVIFLIILGNFALLYLLGPFLGWLALFFLMLFYIAGLKIYCLKIIPEWFEALKTSLKQAFISSLIVYLLFFLFAVFSFILLLVNSWYPSVLFNLIVFPLLIAAIYSLIFHLIFVPSLLASNWKEFKNLILKNLKLLTSKEGILSFIVLVFFVYLTLLAGTLKFLHFTIGLFAVISTFWLTFYVFLNSYFLKNFIS